MAAMAMAIRSDGHSLFVATMVDNNAATNAWRTWPADRGPEPEAAAERQTGRPARATRHIPFPLALSKADPNREGVYEPAYQQS